MFLGYSYTSKAYRVFKKRTQYVEKIINVIFNITDDLGNSESLNNDEIKKLLHIQKYDLEQEENGTLVK